MKRYLWIFSTWAWPSAALAAWQPDSSPAESAWRLSDPHSLILLVILVVFAAVCGAMIQALFKHRRPGRDANHHQSALIELIWAFIPLLILVGMAWPTATAVLSQDSGYTPDSRISTAAIATSLAYERVSMSERSIRPVEFDSSRK